jgi:hypothetical protein
LLYGCATKELKMRNPWKLTSLVVISMFVGVLGRGAIDSASADVQPKMQTALTELREAATALEAADRDKGGHRAKALQLTKSAIAEVEQGIKFDNKH